MRQGRDTRVLAGFVVLHVLCCGALLLAGAGLLAVAGGLLGQPLLVAGGAALLVVAVGPAMRRVRATSLHDVAPEPAGLPRHVQSTADRV